MYTYKLGDSLYINLTNLCTNNCVFCIRNKQEGLGINLWLDREPSALDVINEISNPDSYKEIVFCGYGEPTMRLSQILQICRYLRDFNVPIRLDTNGQGNLIWGKNIVQEFAGLIDTVSISLNAKDSEQYQKLCNPDAGEFAYPAILEFAEECKKHIPKVVFTVVDVVSAYDIELCRRIAEELGVGFRVRRCY